MGISLSRECAHQIGGGLFVVAHLPQRFPFHGFSVEEAFEIGQELGSGGGHGERGKKEGSDRGVFGRCPHVREERRGALGEVTIFSREGGAPRGVFSLPAHEGHRPAHGNRPTRTRDARIRRFPIFCLHLFTFRLQDVDRQWVAGEDYAPRVFTPIGVQSFETERVAGEGFTLRPNLHRFRPLLTAVVASGRAVRRMKRRVKEKRG